MTDEKKHWTEGVRIGPRIREMLKDVGVGEVFTPQLAYWYHISGLKGRYAKARDNMLWKLTHSNLAQSTVNNALAAEDDWRKMNVRNQLCALVERGYLERVQRGVYCVLKTMEG